MAADAQAALEQTIAVARALNEMLAEVTGLLDRAVGLIDPPLHDVEQAVSASEETQERVRRFLMTMSEHHG